MEDTVRQGFICPFCMDDMGDFTRLAAHVESVHPESSGDLADTVVQNVKGLFDKAKRGMMKLDARNVVDFSQVNAGVSAGVADLANMVDKVQEKARPSRPVAVPPPIIRPQLGVLRSHKEYFAKCRDSCVNESAVLTNTLIIRLDRLINECPSDPNKRRDFEREVVPWSADNEAPLCRCCAAKFGLTRRRHHCRLCGRVMCHNCSRSLPFISARKLTSSGLFSELEEKPPVEESSYSPSHGRKLLDATQRTTEKMKMFFEGAVSRMKSDDGTEVSLGDLLQQDAEECLRVCPPCITHLRRREQMMEQAVPPALVEQYTALDKLITEVSSLAPNYARMANSLNNGETMYTLKAAEEMKTKVVQKQRAIDELSQSLLAGCEENGMSPKQMQLRKNIRIVAVMALQELALSLISLPSKEQYEKLVEVHRQKIARQIDEARRRTDIDKGLKASSSLPLVTNAASSKTSPPPIQRRVERKAADEGWTPQVVASHNPFMEESDRQHPLREQWEIIRSYLSQAAAAGRTDEVDMLERNLRDLEDEMRRTGLDVN